MSKDDYTADQIKVLGGLEAVRKRPAMYIGSTGPTGLHHLVFEVVDNSIDEAMSGFCTKISVTVHLDNSVTVVDDGRGIPVDMHKTEKRSAAEVVMTKLHAGGKFDRKSYKVSGGLHGVGLSVVNALSEHLMLEIWRDGKVYMQEYSRGKPMTPFEEKGRTTRRGTKIHFKPDPEIFEDIEFSYETLSSRLRELAFLNKGVTIIITDERYDRSQTFQYQGGIVEFVKHLDRNKKNITPEPIYIAGSKGDVELEIAMQYNKGYSETVLSFANAINTIEGGTHLSGFRAALTRTLNNYASSQRLLKGSRQIEGIDTREGLTAIVSVRLPEPQFEGQTKTKLGNSEIKGIVENIVNQKLAEYLLEHPKEGRKIVEKVLLAAQAREAAKKARDLVKKKASVESGLALPGKLADCQSKNPEECELFIVEGDSAGGSAKQARDRRFQAVLPIRGKILNVEKSSVHKMLENEGIKTIITALGTGIQDGFDITKLRYHKIIIMTDADVDGSHITTLLLTLFFQYLPEIIERGYLYIAQPPLFRVHSGGEAIYIRNENELDRYILADGSSGVELITNAGSVKGAVLVKYFLKVRAFQRLLDYFDRHGIPEELLLILLESGNLSKHIFDEDARMEQIEMLNRFRSSAKKLGYDVEYHRRYNEEYLIFEPMITFSSLKRRGSIELTYDFMSNPDFEELIKLHRELSSLGQPPYTLEIPGEGRKEFATLDELVEFVEERGRRGKNIQRYKGLGEMNPEQLWETTMNVETRTLLQVRIDDRPAAEETFDILMGSRVQPRRKFIEEHALEVRNLDI
ncbi:DNA topoisomerase (ATP-hydrolyzing) subunit B [bacterium]|nr:DNA topoisomerase (ATP-hydrolyzing) subunit B [bacterium]